MEGNGSVYRSDTFASEHALNVGTFSLTEVAQTSLRFCLLEWYLSSTNPPCI